MLQNFGLGLGWELSYYVFPHFPLRWSPLSKFLRPKKTLSSAKVSSAVGNTTFLHILRFSTHPFIVRFLPNSSKYSMYDKDGFQHKRNAIFIWYSTSILLPLTLTNKYLVEDPNGLPLNFEYIFAIFSSCIKILSLS